MKKRTLLLTALFAFILTASAQQSIIKDVFERFVEDKVSSMQKIIDITDSQAAQLKELEVNFLVDVNAAENCFWCNSKKRIEKLIKKKEEKLKEILSLDQYIKYDAIDKKKIKKHPIWMLDK